MDNLQNQVASTNANRIGTMILAKVAVSSCFDRAPDAYTPAIKVLELAVAACEAGAYRQKSGR